MRQKTITTPTRGVDLDLPADSQRQAARVLTIVRQELGMELAYLTEFVGGHQIVRYVVGDPSLFGLERGAALPLDGSYCQLMVEGKLEPVIPDTSRHPVVADLAVTTKASLGAYAGVPVHFEDGRLYGTLCCASQEPVPELRQRDSRLLSVLARVVADALAEDERRGLLEAALASRTDDLREINSKLAASHAEMARRLSMAVEYRDDATGRHVNRVGRLSHDLARVAGLSETEAELIREAAALHDVGKVAIPDAILMKPGRLTDEERAVVNTHAQVGHDLLADSESPLLQMAARIALTHHERFDGTGYPSGLAGVDIPVEGRIVAIVDVYDALSSDRVYRAALPGDDVRRLLAEGRGTQFDPRLLEIFLAQAFPKDSAQADSVGARIGPTEIQAIVGR